MTNEEENRYRTMIAAACQRMGLTIDGWVFDEDEKRITARLGRWSAMEDDEDEGVFADDEGDLNAVVVGKKEYGNERVSFGFMPDGMDAWIDINPSDLEPIQQKGTT